MDVLWLGRALSGLVLSSSKNLPIQITGKAEDKEGSMAAYIDFDNLKKELAAGMSAISGAKTQEGDRAPRLIPLQESIEPGGNILRNR